MQRKHKKLMDFAKKTTVPGQPSGERGVEEVKPPEQVKSSEEVNTEQVLREVIELLMQKQREYEREVAHEAELRSQIVKEEEKKEISVSDDILFDLATTAFLKSEVKLIDCGKQGVCNDGKKLGEVFEDDKGLKWQRSFLNTTRLPIFLDFIAEEALMRGRVGKASIVISSRGVQAIIPDDFLCEAITRYGILMKVDKCVNYKPSPWAEKARRRQK